MNGSEPVILEARGVRKRFGPTEALRGAELTVTAGETIAIIGASGSGKSTLLYCLAGILAPDDGEVWFAGRRIDNLRERERSALRRRQFGFVFQFGQLVPELSALENVALPLMLDGVARPQARERAGQWLTRLGAEAVTGLRPGELSGGQAQRVAIARALVARPAVVFADEPTGSLDSVASEEVMAVLTEVARAEGTTMLVVTHEPRVAAYAHREVILRDGAVAPLGMVTT
jgi:putative ABC transport system ATP-binding protein